MLGWLVGWVGGLLNEDITNNNMENERQQNEAYPIFRGYLLTT